jgi:hypothetical protein
MHSFVILGIAFSTLAAQPDMRGEGVEARERAAKRACLAGDPVKGVEVLTDLYLDTNDPTYIYNQGRCYEQNYRYEEAIARFREYLVKAKKLTPEIKAETEGHIAACQSYLATTPVPVEPVPTQMAWSQPDANPKRSVVELQAVRDLGSRGSGYRVAGVVTSVVGAAAMVTGIILNVKANSLAEDVQNNYNPNIDANRQDYKTGAWICYGASATFFVGGVVLYLVGWSKGRSPGSTVSLVPSVQAGAAGAVLTGAF